MPQPSPSRPSAFKRQRVLIIGCGDVGRRVVALLQARVRVMALSRQPQQLADLRGAGLRVLRGDLDQAATLARLGGLADRVLHLAPPPTQGTLDQRTARALVALSRRRAPQSCIYASTSGVYGDAQGAWVEETRMPAPRTERAHRRCDAERRWRHWGRALALRHGTRSAILRVPGIYALDRVGGDPRERLRLGTPLPVRADATYTNHIHADDLARAAVLALWRAVPLRVYHVCDDTHWSVGHYYDWVADHFGLPRAPRISDLEAQTRLSAMQRSFLAESRRLSNHRLKLELGLRLRYPGVQQGLSVVAPQGS